MTTFELKLLSQDSIPGALAKAERYRLLNQPAEAESIYLDVLQVEPHNQEALVGMLLAITDQFGDGQHGSVGRAREILPRIADEYDRAYYAGIICERRAKAVLRHAGPGAVAMADDLLREANRHYERAETLRPPGNDDALLRWNACTRLLMRYARVPAGPEERYEPYAD
jgi:hypothetical protein